MFFNLYYLCTLLSVEGSLFGWCGSGCGHVGAFVGLDNFEMHHWVKLCVIMSPGRYLFPLIKKGSVIFGRKLYRSYQEQQMYTR